MKEKKKNLDIYLTLLTNINSKWIIDLKVRAITIKLLEDSIGEVYVDDFEYGDGFLDTKLRTRPMTEIIDKLDLTKMKAFAL